MNTELHPSLIKLIEKTDWNDEGQVVNALSHYSIPVWISNQACATVGFVQKDGPVKRILDTYEYTLCARSAYGPEKAKEMFGEFCAWFEAQLKKRSKDSVDFAWSFWNDFDFITNPERLRPTWKVTFREVQ